MIISTNLLFVNKVESDTKFKIIWKIYIDYLFLISYFCSLRFHWSRHRGIMSIINYKCVNKSNPIYFAFLFFFYPILFYSSLLVERKMSLHFHVFVTNETIRAWRKTSAQSGHFALSIGLDRLAFQCLANLIPSLHLLLI